MERSIATDMFESQDNRLDSFEGLDFESRLYLYDSDNIEFYATAMAFIYSFVSSRGASFSLYPFPF